MSSTGLSVNEIYCLKEKGYLPGNLVSGNSVFSLGSVRGLSAAAKIPFGEEYPQITKFLRENRQTAYQRMMAKTSDSDAAGIADVSIELLYHAGFIEFISTGSVLRGIVSKDTKPFSTPADGQALYAQLDAGYTPLGMALGNISYSIGMAQGLFGNLKTLAHGEMQEFSAVLNATRRQALERLCDDATTQKANIVLGINTIISPFGKACDLRMIGTAAYHSRIAGNEIASSALSNIELWHLTRMSYVPLRLLMATSIYSVGLASNTAVKGFSHGEVNEMTAMMNSAREKSLASIQDEAKSIGADDVVGVKTYTYQLGNGLIEFLTLGTAVKKMPGIKTESEQLPVQAAMLNEESFYNRVGNYYNAMADVGNKFVFTGLTPGGSILRIFLVVLIIAALIWLSLKK